MNTSSLNCSFYGTDTPRQSSFVQVAKLGQKGYSEIMNKGVKTSEFWLNLLAVGAPAAQAAFTGRTDSTSVLVTGILAAIYTIARAYLKGLSDDTPAPTVVTPTSK